MNERQQYDLGEMIMKSLDGGASESDFKQLRQILISNPEAMAYYMEYISLYACLQSPGDVFPKLNGDFDLQIWQSLAEYEKAAEPVEQKMPNTENSCVSIEGSIQRRPDSGIRRNAIITLIISIAALVLLVLLARHLPLPTGIEVATLSDGMKARWDASSESKAIGTRMVTGYTPLSLREGIIELKFDNTATVVIEGPAQFSLLTEDRIKLDYGKLYAVVPPKAIGFTVNTPNSKMIDLGTEFGIQAEGSCTTELHVIRGKINLLGGTTSKTSMEVCQGYAKRVSGSTSLVSEIPIKETLFARHIDSKAGMIWRSESAIAVVTLPATGTDAATGISSSKTYTHLLDFGRGTAAIINGVAFTPIDHKRIVDTTYEDNRNQFRLQRSVGADLSQTLKGFNECACMFADGGMRELLFDYTSPSFSQPGAYYTLILTGLKPGTHYSLRIYYCPYEDYTKPRELILTFTGDGKQSQIKVDQNSKGSHYINYDYIANSTEVSVKFETLTDLQNWHLYGVTNEVISKE